MKKFIYRYTDFKILYFLIVFIGQSSESIEWEKPHPSWGIGSGETKTKQWVQKGQLSGRVSQPQNWIE